MATYNFDFSVELSKEQTIEIFAQVGNDSRLSPVDLKWLGIDNDFEKWDTDELVKVTKVLVAYLNANSTPFPYWLSEWDEICVVDTYTFYDQIDCFKEAGLKVSYAQWNKLENCLEGSELDGMSAFVADGSKKILYLSTKSRFEEVKPIEWLQVNHLAKLGNNLDDKGFIDFLSMFANFKVVSETVVDLPTIGNVMSTYSQARFNFERGEIQTGRDFAVRSKAFVNGCGMLSNKILMMLLALQLAGMSEWGVGQTVIDGTIAFLTQLWEEEDLYGQVMDSNQQLRTIRENTCSLLKVVPNYQFPYFRLENNNSKDGVAEAVNYCIENKIPFMTDKNAMKRLVTGAGVTALAAAMLFDEEDGIAKLSTILDIAKPGKVLNRGWNMVAIAAEQGLDFQENFRPYVQAGLVFEHDADTHIVVKGDKRLTLTHDGRLLTNGSGVGLTKKGFAYSARKTLRGTLNSISIKEGETLDSIKADMELKLSEILSSDRTIKSTDSTEDKVIFKYRGKELIKYKGLNQDIILSTKYGCSFEVRKLATSKSLYISVTVVYFADDCEIKGRGIAIKAVLKKGNNVYILTEDGQEIEWEVALNSECLKGTASRLHQYAEYLLDQTGKQSFINFSTNILRTPAMEGSYYEQDLNDETCDFYTWWKENTKQYIIRDFVDYETYFKPIILGHVGLDSDCSNDKVYEALANDVNKDIRLVNPVSKKYTLDIEEALDPSGKLVFVEEVVRGVLAPYTFQVEMATVRECTVPAQSPTLQQLCATYAAKPELGYKLLKDAHITENAILGCAAMALNDPSLRGLDDSDDLSQEGSKWEDSDSYTLTAKEIATVLNVSQFGMGYANIYDANEDPFLAFSEPGVEKKFKAKGLVNKVGLVQKIPGSKFTVKEVIDGTSWNYQVNVGTGYNVASVLTCEAALARYALIRASKAKDKAATQQALNRLKLIAKTQGLGWITGYEDSWLCGFNLNGMELANELHEFRKLYVDDFKTLSGNIIKGKTFGEIITQLTDRLEAISGIKFEQAVVVQFLWGYRIARGISALEKYSDTNSVAKAFSMTAEDMQMVAIAGAMRRCDQGRFANFLDANEEDEDSTGISVWTYLNSMWSQVQDQIPFFLRRKLYKSMIVQTEFADLTRSINNASEIGGKQNSNSRVLVKNDLTTGSSKVTVLLPEGEVEVPLVPLEFGSIDEKETADNDAPYGLDVNEDFYSFGQLHGAFEYLHRYCPLNEEGKRDLTSTPDKVVKLKNSDQVLNFWVDTLSSKELIERAAQRYPNGVVIYSADGTDDNKTCDLEVYFNFQDLLLSAAFMGGGQSTGIALNIAELLLGISSPYANRPNGWTTRARNLLAGIQGQMREMMKAGLLRRIGRVKPFAQGSKVMTSHSVPNVEIIERGVSYSIPVFLVNPHDDLVKVGNYKAGDYCAMFRTPQIAKCYGVLLFDETVSIGHIECNAFLNAKTHRGDGDGDPCAIEKLHTPDNAHLIVEAYWEVLETRKGR